MTIEDFITNLANAIEVDPSQITEATEFKLLESWDSLCVLSVIAMTDEVYQVSIGGNDIVAANTVAELMSIIVSRK